MGLFAGAVILLKIPFLSRLQKIIKKNECDYTDYNLYMKNAVVKNVCINMYAVFFRENLEIAGNID